MRTLVGAVLALAVPVALAACAKDTVVTERTSPAASSASSASTVPGSSGASGSSGSSGDAERWLLPDDALPAGWRRATGQQQLGTPQLCGVRLEPPSVTDVSTRRYARAYEGPFVVQYSFVSGDPAATEQLMARWARAAAVCGSSEADGVTLEVTPLTDLAPVGEDFGAVHAAAPGGQQRDYVAFRDGAHVTVLISVGIGSLAGHDELAAFAQAVSAR